jgi:hypothetical protein
MEHWSTGVFEHWNIGDISRVIFSIPGTGFDREPFDFTRQIFQV